jgi:hypothetical protein
MAKKKVAKRVSKKKVKGLLDSHPNLIWLVPLFVLSYFLFVVLVKP